MWWLCMQFGKESSSATQNRKLAYSLVRQAQISDDNNLVKEPAEIAVLDMVIHAVGTLFSVSSFTAKGERGCGAVKL